MAQSIGDAAAKWWLGIASVVTAAGILFMASFAYESAITMQKLSDTQDAQGAKLTGLQQDVRDLRDRLDRKP